MLWSSSSVFEQCSLSLHKNYLHYIKTPDRGIILRRNIFFRKTFYTPINYQCFLCKIYIFPSMTIYIMVDLLFRSLYVFYATLESLTWISRETGLCKHTILRNIQFLVFRVMLFYIYCISWNLSCI